MYLNHDLGTQDWLWNFHQHAKNILPISLESRHVKLFFHLWSMYAVPPRVQDTGEPKRPGVICGLL